MNNELRIGNWIQDGNEFEQITIDHLNCLNSGRCEYDPITLTEEWLLKFGFEKVLNQYKKITDVSKDTFKNIPFIILFLDNQFQYDDLRFRTNLQYVHQLQNLYFALTGDELTIKNK
jgi:hypothetical protein